MSDNPGKKLANKIKKGARGITTPYRVLKGTAKTADKIGRKLTGKK